MQENDFDCKPKVSVVIPTFGGSESLSESIDSVLEQLYCNYEVIVVDDNDPNTIAREKTEAVMWRYREDSRVKYLKHEKNKNGAAARNTGVRHSDAKYICLLDDDDLFLQNRIIRQVEFLEKNSEFQACYCWRSKNGRIISSVEEGDLTKSMLDLSFSPTTSAIMMTKDAYESLEGFDETYRRHQDYEFLLRFFKKYKMGVVKEVLLEFVGNEIDNQLYGKKLYNLKKQFFSQFGHEVELLDNSNPGYKQRVYAAHFSEAIIQLIKKGNFILALKLYFSFGIKGGVLFWKYFFRNAFGWVGRKIRKNATK